MPTETDKAGETPNSEASETEAAQSSTSTTQDQQPTIAELQAKIAELAKALKAANDESAKRRKKLEQYERADADRAEADKTDAQKTAEKITALETQLAEARTKVKRAELRDAFRLAAAKAKLTWASASAESDAFELSNLMSSESDDDDDTKEAIKDALKALQADRPYLFGRPQQSTDIDATKRGDPPNGQKLSDEEKRELGAVYGVDPKYIPDTKKE